MRNDPITFHIKRAVFIWLILINLIYMSDISAHELSMTAARENYLELGTVHDDNVSPGHISTIRILQTSDTKIGTLKMDNDSSSGDSYGLFLEAGHIWPIKSQWAYSIGGNISENTFRQNGDAYYLNENVSYPYHYDIRVAQINVTSRLIHTIRRWQLYLEAHAGLAYLTTKNYSNENGTQSDYFYSNTEAQPDYGFSLGIVYAVTRQDGISFSMGYTDLGKAKFLQREMYSPESSEDGEVTQQVSVLSGKISFVHWF